MSCRLVPKSLTLNGEMVHILRFFVELCSFQGALRKNWLKIYRYFEHQKCSPKHLVFRDISLNDDTIYMISAV